MVNLASVTKKKAMICNLDDPTPVAYMNLYEQGDVWVKIVGCKACPIENRQKCCGNCPQILDGQCAWHMVKHPATSGKPWNCVAKPYPDQAMSFCSLQYQSVAGSRVGQIRRASDPADIFQGQE